MNAQDATSKPRVKEWGEQSEVEYPDMQANLEEVDEIIEDDNTPWQKMREGHKQRQQSLETVRFRKNTLQVPPWCP